jgi:pimeloyl-ACP methyl ester carboxylesterase
MIWFILILAILYIMALVGVALCFVYPFRTPIFLSPGFLGTAQEPIEFIDPTTEKILRGWWVPHHDPKVVMICCHGFMMNRAELAPFAPRFKDHSMAFLFFDFPAHGSSQGRRSGFGFREKSAVAAAVGLARVKYPNAKIVLAGSSMGAVASSFALSENPSLADGLILDSCYDRLNEAVSGWWLFLGGKKLKFLLALVVWLGWPLSGLNLFSVVVSKALTKVNVPTLILHGTADTLAPFYHAEANYAALAGPKTLVSFEGRNHSEARWEEPEKYFDAIDAFLIQSQFLH